MKNKLAKNSLAVGVVTLIITAGLSFSANGADAPVAQGTASAVKGTGLLNILDGGQCAATFAGDGSATDGVPTGRCGDGLKTPSIDAYSQNVTAGKDGHSAADASVAPIDALDLHTTLNLTDVINGLAAIDTGSILDPLVGGVGGLLKTLFDTLKLAGIDVLGTIDSTLQTVLKGLDSALPISLKVGAVNANATADPGSATGTSTVAGLALLVKLGGTNIEVPFNTLGTAPNSDLLIGAPQDLVDGIIKTLEDTLVSSLNGSLAGLNLLLAPLQTQLLDPLFTALEPTLLKSVSAVLKPIVSGTVNRQVPVSPTSGEIDVTALHLEVLGADNSLDLARVHVGPNAGPKTSDDTDTQQDQADVNTQADTQQDQADVDTQADADAAADSDAQADADVTTTLPGTGAPNLTPFWMLGLGLLLFGTTVLINEKRRFGKQ